MNRVLGALIVATLTFSRAFAVVLLEEPFSYTNGFLTSVSAGRWSSHSGTANQVDISTGEVNLVTGETEDVNALLDGQPYLPSGLSNVFYARFSVRFAAAPSSGGAWFAAFKDQSATGFRCRVFALRSGAASEKFRLGLSTSGNTAATVTNQTDLSLNTTYTVVLKLTNRNSISTMWLNPSSQSDPSITTSEADSTFTVSAFALRQSTGIGRLTLDDLVVATSFEDLFGNSPAGAPAITIHPESQTVNEGDNVTFASAAKGEPPLSFQWLLNSDSIPAATNESLTLSNVTASHQGDYRVIVTNFFGSVTSVPAALIVTPKASGPTNVAFTVLNYNTHGSFVADWSTNSPQVQAIGRQVQFLNPDIITFQEIPLTNNGAAQMADFVAAFRPGYHLATNSGTDGFTRSVILSRHPIMRSAKWLDGASLTNFGYRGTFTRDLFEAEIAVPVLPQPVHVFTTHLKSGQDSDDTARRGAEARAISNFFATIFLATNSLRPYLLTGDLNEDISDPPAGGAAIPTLTGTQTGLHLTRPLNPVTQSHLTFSIQTEALTRRYDYILPCTLLATNITRSQVFRTDVATNINPALPGDSREASDHLPVFIAFANPYATSFRITRFGLTNDSLTLTWNCVPGGRYRVEGTTNLTGWSAFATNLLAGGPTHSFTVNVSPASVFLRVRTEP